MCTCITYNAKSHYFGRNLDLEYHIDQSVLITPRRTQFSLKNGDVLRTDYAMTGIGTRIGDYPLYAEAANEKGLALAGLNFPGNAVFFSAVRGKLNLAQYELFPFLLGRYSTVEEVKGVLADLNITDVPFMADMPPGTLHWMMSDKTQSIVIEQTAEGLKVYDNPIGVLTNNPPFPYHLANINNYMGLSAYSGTNNFSREVELKAYCQGMGAMGLPGDTSSPSRFVRAAFNKFNSLCDGDEACAVTQFFHILDSVAMLNGSTYALNGKADKTVYSCCINLDSGTYYYKTYENSAITAVTLGESEKNAKKLIEFALRRAPAITFENAAQQD